MDGTIPAKLTPAGRDVLLGRCTGLFTIKFFGGILKASVTDKTDLSGMYEFQFTYQAQLDSTGPTLFTTIEDLGMHLETSARSHTTSW